MTLEKAKKTILLIVVVIIIVLIGALVFLYKEKGESINLLRRGQDASFQKTSSPKAQDEAASAPVQPTLRLLGKMQKISGRNIEIEDLSVRDKTTKILLEENVILEKQAGTLGGADIRSANTKILLQDMKIGDIVYVEYLINDSGGGEGYPAVLVRVMPSQ